MKNNLIFFTTGSIILLFVLSACQGPALVVTSAPEQELTALPSAAQAPPEPISQFAISARSDAKPMADSEPLVTDPNWGHAIQALGEWDSFFCQKLDRNSWIVGDQEELAILEVFYKEAVIPLEIYIYATFGGHQIVKVELLDTSGDYHELSNEEVIDDDECFYTLYVPVEDASYEAMGVRITVDPSLNSDLHQIDAVELYGIPTGKMVEVPESQEIVEPPPIGERVSYDRPDDFPNTYQIHVIYLLGSDNIDRERDINGQITKSFKLANEWMFENTEQTGGQEFRMDTYQGELDITFHRLQATESEINIGAIDKYGTVDSRAVYLTFDSELFDLIAPELGKLYIVLAEFEHGLVFSGQSTGAGFMYLYPRADRTQRPAMRDQASGFERTILHELIHEIGFVQECALTFQEGAHTSDDNQDLMWSPADPFAVFYYDVDNMVLDYGNDDYYNHNIPDCPDLADSVFLVPTSDDPYLPERLEFLAFPE